MIDIKRKTFYIYIKAGMLFPPLLLFIVHAATGLRELKQAPPCVSSFSGADFRPDEEEDAGNPWWLSKDDDKVWAENRPIKPARVSTPAAQKKHRNGGG